MTVSEYLSEPIVVEGIVETTRGALIRDWRAAGVPNIYIDRWLQGFDVKQRSES